MRDLAQQFGNLGLAAVAYNGGPTRTANWLQGHAELAYETRAYVIAITGRSAEDWAGDARRSTPVAPLSVEPVAPAPTQAVPAAPPAPVALAPAEPMRDEQARESRARDAPKQGPAATCLELVAVFRQGGDRRIYEPYAGPPVALSPLAPWGVQLAGDFSKDRALASYARTRQRYAAILNDVNPMVIGTRFRSRGTGAFYRVRVPAATRAAAEELCGRLHKIGGACVVLKS